MCLGPQAMRSPNLASTILLSLICVLRTAVSLAAVPPQVSGWFVDSLTKVFPDDLPLESAGPGPEVVAARNSHASLQWVLRSPGRVANLSVGVEGLKGREGETPEVQVRTVGYVVVSSNTHDTPPSEIVRSAPGLFPDVLFERAPFEIEPNRAQPVWITITIPSTARPANYRCRLVIRAGGKELAQGVFT